MKIKIKTPSKTSKSSKVKKKNPFDAVLDKSQEMPVIVQFFTQWCGPCQALKPVMENAAKKAKGKWALAMVDVEQHQAAAMGYNIRSVPEVKMFYKGEPIAAFKGAKPEYIVQNWLDSNLPKKKRKNKYTDADNLLRNGNVHGAMSNILHILHQDNPDAPIAKILLALQSLGHNNAQAMMLINQVEKKGEFKDLVKSIRDRIDMDVDEKDHHTPTHSPYNPKTTKTSANDRIDLRKFNHGLLVSLVEDLVNEVRSSRGANSLRGHSILEAAAKDQNEYQIKHDVLSHHQKNQRKKTVKNRVDVFGGKQFRTVGENVQYQGFQVVQRGNQVEIVTDTYIHLAQKLVENWVKSPGHYKNMINPNFDFVGTSIGWNPENRSIFATQVFGG